jgi:hypothetical protein
LRTFERDVLERGEAAERQRQVVDRQQRFAAGGDLAGRPHSAASLCSATRNGLHVADLDVGGNHALAAVLEGHFGADVLAVLAGS